jgi:hypothetical protein
LRRKIVVPEGTRPDKRHASWLMPPSHFALGPSLLWLALPDC